MTDDTRPLFKVCKVPGCGPVPARQGGYGMCALHYGRWRKTGTTEARVHVPKVCKVEGCGLVLKPPYGRGMCSVHYYRWKRYGDPTLVVDRRPKIQGVIPCSIDGCIAVSHSLGLCTKHYNRRLRGGDPLAKWSTEVERMCAICDQPYMGSGRQAKTCGTAECRLELKKRYGREGMAARRLENPKPKVITHYTNCEYCGEKFGANSRQFRYCSRACVVGDKRRGYYVKRRADKAAVAYESFRNIEIFKRDKWQCGICGDRIDPKIAWPDPWSASLDHVMPISLGGGHLRSNTQAAHLRCNCSKGNRVA